MTLPAKDTSFEIFLNYSHYLSSFCKPFFAATGIDHFSYVEIDTGGKFFWLGTDQGYLKRCIDLNHVEAAPLRILKTYPKTGYYLIDNYQEPSKEHSRAVLELLGDFDYAYSFRILEQEKTRIKLYSYESLAHKQGMNQVYLNNLDALKKFNTYFDSTLHSFRKKIKIPSINNKYLLEFSALWEAPFESMNLSYAVFNEDHIRLTSREKEILDWYIKGKSAEETGKLLNISKRTVERHFENLRHKTGCFSKHQIFLKTVHLL